MSDAGPAAQDLVLVSGAFKRAGKVGTVKRACPDARVEVVSCRDGDVRRGPAARKLAKEARFCVVVGYCDHDLYLAASTKSVLVAIAGEEKEGENKCSTYGLTTTWEKLGALMGTLRAPTSCWFFTAEYKHQEGSRQVPISVHSLLSAMTRFGGYSSDDKRLFTKFRLALKKDGVMQDVVVALILGAWSRQSRNCKDGPFASIDVFGFFPSSDAESKNEPLRTIKERLRILTGKRKPGDLLLRTRTIEKSHHGGERHPTRHLRSVCVNPEWGSLVNKSVCIIDDFCTSGASFEAAKLLLVEQGVKRVLFLSFGKFGLKYTPYYRSDGNIIRGTEIGHANWEAGRQLSRVHAALSTG